MYSGFVKRAVYAGEGPKTSHLIIVLLDSLFVQWICEARMFGIGNWQDLPRYDLVRVVHRSFIGSKMVHWFTWVSNIRDWDPNFP